MSFPSRVDGVGTRINSSGLFNEPNLGGQREKFVRMFASEAIAKGDVVCFDFADVEPTNGYGNHVRIADANATQTTTAVAQELRSAIGIASEAIASGDLGLIQVQGYCDYAKATTGSCAPGEPVTCHTDPGELAVVSSAETIALGIYIADGTDGTASSKVFLINPANL
tara:strand:+ start:631 stop:1134 length:504 start_codon:yes stop_codon:yes gene_type:complete